jgi:hypothetical protein
VRRAAQGRAYRQPETRQKPRNTETNTHVHEEDLEVWCRATRRAGRVAVVGLGVGLDPHVQAAAIHEHARPLLHTELHGSLTGGCQAGRSAPGTALTGCADLQVSGIRYKHRAASQPSAVGIDLWAA